MAAKKDTTVNKTGASITNCSVVVNNSTAANEHTASAITALANAAKANADALAEMARALKGGNVSSGPGISLTNVRADDTN